MGTKRKPTKRDTLSRALLEAIEQDGRSLYAIAKHAGLAYSTVQRFTSGERPGISIATAAKLADELDLALQPKGRA